MLTAAQITTQQWIDAYTAHLEGVAEATSSTHLKKEMTKALDHAVADARQSGKEEDHIIVAQQRDVLARSGLGHFDREAFALIRQLWKECATALKTTGFILAEPIDVEQNPSEWVFTQFKAKIRCPLQMAQVMMAFLTFVNKRSEESRESPLDYTKRMLAEQGITKDNWHLHAHNTALTDPWADERGPEGVRKILLP
jgi:hypothetical protein